MKRHPKFIVFTSLLLLMTSPGLAETDSSPLTSPSDLLKRDWYEENGVVLPRPIGIGFNYIYMGRDIEVTDVNVSFLGLPPQSVADLAEFAVENETTLSMARIDAWILPFLNAYIMLGETRTDTSLYVTFEADPGNGDPTEEVTVVENSKVSGPLYGVGSTIVYGGNHWFCMADANYSRSDIGEFDDPIDAWYLSARLGWHHTTEKRQYRTWGGLAYLDSARTLSITTQRPVIGNITVQVDQKPVNPWNAALGGSVSINRRWDIMAELGSNFSDATVIVCGITARFF